MNKKMKLSFLGLLAALLVTLLFGTTAGAQTEKAASAHASAVQRPLYSDYKGVSIGMAAAEVRAKLGTPQLASDDQDYYIVSQAETVQVFYDAAHKAKAISIDFIDGVGAPDYRTVVGSDMETNPDGSMHKRVTASPGVWVTYNRSAGTVVTVTITIQKSL